MRQPTKPPLLLAALWLSLPLACGGITQDHPGSSALEKSREVLDWDKGVRIEVGPLDISVSGSEILELDAEGRVAKQHKPEGEAGLRIQPLFDTLTREIDKGQDASLCTIAIDPWIPYSTLVAVIDTADKARCATLRLVTRQPDKGWEGVVLSTPELTLGGTRVRDPAKRGEARDNTGAKVIAGKPQVTGALDTILIERVVKTHRRELLYCYEQALHNNEALSGRLVVHWYISSTGSVVAASTDEGGLGRSRLSSCITSKVRRWSFPEPQGGGVVKVTHPFVFKRPIEGAVSTQKQAEPEGALNLIVKITTSGFTVATRGERILPMSGCPEAGPATLCPKDDLDVASMLADARWKRASSDRYKQARAKDILQETVDAYDQRRLGGLLQGLKRKHPKETLATLVADPDIPFEVIVETLDTVRFETDEASHEGARPTESSRLPLFPDIAFAVLR